MDKNQRNIIAGEDMRMHKLTVQIWRVFVWVTVIFSGILALGAYASIVLGLVSVGEHSVSFFALLIIAGVYMMLSSVAAFYMVSRVFAPLEELSEASKQVAKGDFNIQVTYQGRLEELGSTIDNFNRMVKELNSVEIMRNDFIANVSHEFKTPLAAITGYATFLQDSELSQKEKDEYIRKIFFNVDKLNELTENILQLSKLEHQQFLNEPVCYRLDEQLREAIVLLEPKWGRKKTVFDLDLPEVEYIGQKSLLFHVWMNVIGNAIKYTEENGTIEVCLKETEEYCEIIIKDNGIGMTEETMKHIFEKFYQADTSRKAQGNGLGLALCREIINKCGGKIIVESELGVGSVFIIQLLKIEDSQQSLKFS